METKKAFVPGISCPHCVNTIQNEIAELDGVQSVKANAQTREVVFEWTSPATWEGIVAEMEEIGYPVASGE